MRRKRRKLKRPVRRNYRKRYGGRKRPVRRRLVRRNTKRGTKRKSIGTYSVVYETGGRYGDPYYALVWHDKIHNKTIKFPRRFNTKESAEKAAVEHHKLWLFGS